MRTLGTGGFLLVAIHYGDRSALSVANDRMCASVAFIAATIGCTPRTVWAST